MSTELFSAEQMAAAELPPPPAPPAFLLRAYWCHSPGRWTFKGEYNTFEDAERAAKRLLPGWTHYQIWRVGR
ncbi:MAG: hypothetical protein WC655_16700 [Candidatus Hydrogenedentales bacterium]